MDLVGLRQTGNRVRPFIFIEVCWDCGYYGSAWCQQLGCKATRGLLIPVVCPGNQARAALAHKSGMKQAARKNKSLALHRLGFRPEDNRLTSGLPPHRGSYRRPRLMVVGIKNDRTKAVPFGDSLNA